MFVQYILEGYFWMQSKGERGEGDWDSHFFYLSTYKQSANKCNVLYDNYTAIQEKLTDEIIFQTKIFPL